MRSLLAAVMLLAAAWAQADVAAPTLRSALETADAATAEEIAVASAELDAREAALRELEFRTEKMRLARDQMQQAMDAMAADPNVDPGLYPIACKAAAQSLRAPEFFRLLRNKVKTLEKPKNFGQLSTEQVERLKGAKASIAALESQPDISCGPR